MKIRSTARLAFPLASAIAALLVGGVSSIHAASLYWDGTSTTADADGGNGTWNTSNTNWDTLLRAGADTVWVNANLYTAVFGGTAGTATLGEAITTGGLRFNTNNYTVAAGANGLSFSGNSTVGLYSIAAATITGTIGSTAANMTFTALNPLTAGTVTFGGTNTTGWSGTTTVNGGMTLAVEGSTGNRALGFTSGITLNGGSITTGSGVTSANNTVDFFSNSAAITVNGGGSITYGPVNAGPTFSETIGAVTANSGQMAFGTGSISSGSATLVIPSITRSSSTSALVFQLRNSQPLVDGNFNKIQVTGSGTTSGWVSGANSNPIIGPWATTGTAGAVDYAVYSGNNVVSANTAANIEANWTDSTKAYTLNSGLGITTLGATRNITALRNRTGTALTSVNTTTETITLTGHTLVNGDTVVFGASAPGGLTTGTTYFVVGTATDTFQVSTTSGGAAVNLTSAGTAPIVARPTTLTAGTGANLGTLGILNASTIPMVITATGTGVVTLPSTTADNLHVNAATGAVAISAPITDNTGALTLVKNGGSNLTLSGNNTFTGGLVNNAGSTTLSGTNTFGTGAVTINGGTVTFSNHAAWGGTGRNVTFNGTGTLTSSVDGYTGGTLTVNAGANAVITSGSTAFATTTGSGTLIANATVQNRLINIGNASTFTGTLQGRQTVNSTNGTNVSLQFSGLADTAGSALQFVGGTGDSNQAYTIAYNGTSALTFNNRQVQILDRLAGNWELRDNILANNSANAAHTWTVNTDLLYTGGRAQQYGPETGRGFILSGSNPGDNAFNGVISNGSNTNGLNLSKAGNGKWIVSGNNTYTGSTTVGAGTLVLSGSNQYTGATTVSGGTLVGIGANAFGSTSGISLAAAGTLSLRGDSNTSFVKASDSTPYTVSNSASSATINVDRVSGTGAATMSVGNLTTSSTAGTWGLNFTGANGVSLSAGTLNTPVSTIAAVHTITNNIAGGGSLTLASVFNQATTVASPDLVFTGTGTTIITGAITQTLAGMDLKKSGTGTLLLNATNTYTGLTSVTDGTLGGSGTIAGDVTVAAAGSLAPGESAGPLSIGGGLDISAPANGGAGKLSFELGPIAASDKLALTGSGTLTIGADVLGFTDFNFDALAGLQNGTYKLITSGSPVSGTLDAADLSGLIDGGPGTGTLQISGSGTDIELVVSGVGAGTPYQNWSGGAAFGDDANGDGVDNGLAFLLGAANPNANALGLLPTVDESGGSLVLSFSMLNAAKRGTATLSLEHSGDLGIADAWTAVLVPDADSGPTSGVTFTVLPGDPKNTVTATISSSEAVGGKLFGRLEASQP